MNIQGGKLNKSRKVGDITVLFHNSHLKKAVCLKGKLKFHNNSGFEKFMNLLLLTVLILIEISRDVDKRASSTYVR